MMILLVDTAVVAAWILALRKLDRCGMHKNSGRTLLAFYIAGMAGTFPTLVLYPLLDLVTLPGSAPASRFAYDLFAAGPLEEPSKFLVLSLTLRSIREPGSGRGPKRPPAGLVPPAVRLPFTLSPFRPYSLNEHRKAVPALKRGLAADSRSFVLNQRLACFYIYRRQYDRALPCLNRCLRTSTWKRRRAARIPPRSAGA